VKNKILCIEDDLTIQTLVAASLKEFEVICVSLLSEADAILKTISFAAILIDIQLPDGDGLRFLTKISQNENYNKIPTMILSGHTEITNKVTAFTFGADDFIEKPFDPLELNARITAKIRKFQTGLEKFKNRTVGDILIDSDRQKVFKLDKGREKDLNLTSIELKILSLLTKRLEQVYSREQIMTQVWGETFITDRTVDSHIAHLRQKIDTTKIQIDTAKNFGYRAILKV
jgi:DNA-binding response OmpR family regulator